MDMACSENNTKAAVADLRDVDPIAPSVTAKTHAPGISRGACALPARRRFGSANHVLTIV